MSLFYLNDSKLELMSYAYACYFTYFCNVIMVDYIQDICSHVVAQ